MAGKEFIGVHEKITMKRPSACATVCNGARVNHKQAISFRTLMVSVLPEGDPPTAVATRWVATA